MVECLPYGSKRDQKEVIMGSFIAQQPNGLYCRFSTIVDTVTHYNMTKDDYIEVCKDRVSYNTLEKCGWKVSENSAIPPIFADEELVLQTECCFGIKISNYQIIELDVEVPDKSSHNKFDDYDPNFKRLIQKAIAYNPRKTKNKR